MLDNHMIGGCNMYEKQDGRDNQNYERYYKYRSAKLTVSHHKWRLNKCEAVQEVNHMQDANNITLSS